MSLTLQIYTLITRAFVLSSEWIKLCLDFMVWIEVGERNSMRKTGNVHDISNENGVFHIVSRENGFSFQLFHRFSQAIPFWEHFSTVRLLACDFSFCEMNFHLFGIYLQWSVILYFLIIIINLSFLHYYWSFFLLLPYDFIFKYDLYLFFYFQSEKKTENEESPFQFVYIYGFQQCLLT